MSLFAIAHMEARRAFFDAVIRGDDIRPEGVYSNKASRRLFKELAAKAQKHYRQRSVLEMADGYVLKALQQFYAIAEMSGAKFNTDEELCSRLDVALLPFFATTALRKELEVTDTVSFVPDLNLVKAVASNNSELLASFKAHKDECFDFILNNAVYIEAPDVSTGQPRNADECAFKSVILSVPSARKHQSMLVVVRCVAGTNWIVSWATANAAKDGKLLCLGYKSNDEALQHFNESFAVLSTCVTLHLERLRIHDELALILPCLPEEVPLSKGKVRRRKHRRGPVLIEPSDPFEAMNLTVDDLFDLVKCQPKAVIADDFPDFTADLAAIRAPGPQEEVEADDGLVDAQVVDDDGNLDFDEDGHLCNRRTGQRYRTPVAAFWRRQPHGPHNSLRRMQLIPRSWRGPVDGPMKTKVYSQALDDDYIPPMPVMDAANTNKRHRQRAV